MAVTSLLAAIGFLLSAYALWVEYRARKAGYRPTCDISGRISCTRAFTSEYGRIAGLPNAVYGLGLYLLAFALSWTQQHQVLLYLAAASVAGSAYLAYLSYFRLRTYCLVCTGIYLVNILLLIFAYAAL